MKVVVSPEIGAVCPEFVGACIEASVINTPYCEPLWQEIEQLGNRFRRIRSKCGAAKTRQAI